MKKLAKWRGIPPFIQKIVRVMKISVFLVLVCALQLSASVMLGQQVSLQSADMSVRQVFKELKTQTGTFFMYSEDEVDSDLNVDVDFSDVSLEVALEEICEQAALTYEIVDDYVLITKKAPVVEKPATQQEKKTIRGIVTDENGETLPGVSVVVKGTNTGVATDIDGNYIIGLVNDDAVLVFSFVGMLPKEVSYSGQKIINVVLVADAADIDEVIVTGIFTRKAESYTGAAITIKAEELKSVGAGNIFQSLKNIDPSLNIMESSIFGSDPNKLPEIQLRGNSSLPNFDEGDDLRSQYLDDPNMPLFILDGFEASATTIFDFDMERIESLTILKDAAAKAIYGSKAANGVIVIETKKPLSGDLRISYTGKLNVTGPDISSYNLTNALEKLEVERIAGDYLAINNDDVITNENYYNLRLKKALEGDDTYWLSKPLQTAVSQRHSLRVEMGEQKVKFIANLSYNNTEGVMIGSDRENVAGSVSLRYRYKNLLFTNQTSVTSNTSVNSPYGNFSTYANMNPYHMDYNPDGSISTDEFPDIANFGNYNNPLSDATLNTKDESSYLELKNNFYAEWTISEGFKLMSRTGLTKTTNESHRFLPASHSSFASWTGDKFFRRGSYSLTEGESHNLSSDLNLQFNKTFGKHFISAGFRANVAVSEGSSVTNYAEGFPSDNTVDFAFATQYADGKKPSGFDNTSREIGFTGMLQYSYFEDRYLADFTLRESGSSKFGANKRWGTFWSVGLGWNVHKESFLKNFTKLKKFKIRGSIGTTGSQNFSTHQAVSTYKLYLDRIYSGQLGAYLKGLANPDLQWQEKRDLNIGFDMVLGRFTVRFDRYQANTTNLVNNLTLPPSVGFNSVKENVGEILNKGIELGVTYKVLQSKNGFLNINANLVTNTNEIASLSDAMKKYNEDQDALASTITNGKPVRKFVEGGSMSTIWAVQSLGIDPATGREIYLNRDGEKAYNWRSFDQINAGNTASKYRGNFGFNGEYKGFGMGVVARFRTGGQMYNSTLVSKVENINTAYNVDERVLAGRWMKPGDDAKYIRLAPVRKEDGTFEYFPATKPTTRFVMDLSEIDISSINLYYRFDRALIKKFGMSQLKISANMNDVYKFSSVKIERGTTYPFARTVSFSLNATF